MCVKSSLGTHQIKRRDRNILFKTRANYMRDEAIELLCVKFHGVKIMASDVMTNDHNGNNRLVAVGRVSCVHSFLFGAFVSILKCRTQIAFQSKVNCFIPNQISLKWWLCVYCIGVLFLIVTHEKLIEMPIDEFVRPKFNRPKRASATQVKPIELHIYFCVDELSENARIKWDWQRKEMRDEV